MTAHESSIEEKNNFLEKNFAPVSEEVSVECTEVIGEIPKDIDGVFLRIGPNPVYVKSVKDYHWFDGDGMIHRMLLKDGKASYQNKWLQTKGLKLEAESEKALWGGMNSMSDLSSFDNPHGPMKNVANTAMVWNNNRLLALWEAGSPHEVKLPNLETIKLEDFNGELEYPFSAHPKVDPDTGEMMACCYSLPVAPHVKYFVINKDGKIVHEEPIDVPKGIMMHDCAITKNYTLILDLPVTFDLNEMMNGKEPLNWDPDNGARIGVIPRYGKNEDVRWFEIEPCMIFHTLNAYEDGDEIILDGSRLKSSSVLRDLEDLAAVDEQKGRMHRWQFNLKTGEVKEKPLHDEPCDFARLNANYVGKKNRYGYAGRFYEATGMPLFDAVLKFDREQDSCDVLKLDEQCFASEAVFAPRINSQSEDDGYVVFFVRDEKNETSEFCIVDAQKFLDGPIARVKIPVRVPHGFHAEWITGEQLATQESSEVVDVMTCRLV